MIESPKDYYRQRFQPVIEYINRNLDKPILLEDVARLSHFSKYHFHRMFSALFDENLGDYVARCRLQAAAQKLVSYPDQSITEVAMFCGYSTSANFTRAFKLHYGVSPREFRNGKVNDAGKFLQIYEFSLDPKRLNFVLESAKQTKKDIQPFAIESCESMRLVTLQTDNGYAIDSIFDTWKKMNAYCRRIGISAQDQKSFAFTYDNPVISPNQTCKYLAGVVLPECIEIVPAPFEVMTIQPLTFAKFQYHGPSHETYQLHYEIYQHWLPYSAYEPDEHPTIEYMPNPVDLDTIDTTNHIDQIELEIWLNIKPLQWSTRSG